MALSNELYFRKYWKVEEILFLIFGKCKDKNGSGFVTRCDEVEIKRNFYVEEDHTLFKSEFEKEISDAIDSGDLKEHKALDSDKSDYLGRNEFSDWLNLKYKIDINHYLYEERLEIRFDEKPDYRDFSDRVYGGGTFTRHEAFCYLRGIPITKDKTTWSDDDIKNHLKFDAYESDKERLNYKEMLAIAGKENINISREIEIIIEEAEKFGIHGQPIETSANKTTDKRSHPLHELIDEVDIKLWDELKKKPTSLKVWNRLEEIQRDSNNCIVEITIADIHWKSRKGVPGKMPYSSFLGTLSDVRKKRREKSPIK